MPRACVCPKLSAWHFLALKHQGKLRYWLPWGHHKNGVHASPCTPHKASRPKGTCYLWRWLLPECRCPKNWQLLPLLHMRVLVPAPLLSCTDMHFNAVASRLGAVHHDGTEARLYDTALFEPHRLFLPLTCPIAQSCALRTFPVHWMQMTQHTFSLSSYKILKSFAVCRS